MSDPAVVVKVRSMLPVEQELFISVDETWTVKDLKNHVSGNFPGQPNVLSQRLVCAGYLLEDDNRLLKEYLRPELGNHHVVHLICKGLMAEPLRDSVKSEQEVVAPGGPREGISEERLGHTTASEADHLYLSMLCYQQFVFYYYMTQLYGNSWLHHYGNATGTSPMASSHAQGESANLNHRNETRNEQPAAQPVINAQGQNEDEEQPRDWLDFLYIVSRTIFLFSVLYMYSTVGRFALVLCCGVFFYALEVGWFGRWDADAHERPPVPPPEHHHQAAASNGDNSDLPTQEHPGPSVTGVPADDPMASTTSRPISPIVSTLTNGEIRSDAAGRQPSAWAVFWSTCRIFVSSFFVSLLPHRPEAFR
uniref:Ubiquitin-like domain-containing protein n=1 Tax=Trichuris muris TaxID=70415 RepID=A0A5S6Q122_TRIMR